MARLIEFAGPSIAPREDADALRVLQAYADELEKALKEAQDRGDTLLSYTEGLERENKRLRGALAGDPDPG